MPATRGTSIRRLGRETVVAQAVCPSLDSSQLTYTVAALTCGALFTRRAAPQPVLSRHASANLPPSGSTFAPTPNFCSSAISVSFTPMAMGNFSRDDRQLADWLARGKLPIAISVNDTDVAVLAQLGLCATVEQLVG